MRALVTGASGDLGRTIAEQLLDIGAEVTVHARSRSTEMPQLRGAKAKYADLADPFAVARLANELSQEWDGLDLLVNNAGGGRPKPLTQLSTSEWLDSLAVNLTAPFLLLRHLLPLLAERRGAVVNVSSVAAFTGGAFGPHYAASKAGLIGLTRSAARELGQLGVRVNAVAPGPVKSEMTDSLPEAVLTSILTATALRRVVTPAEIAEAVVYLASAQGVTGQVLVVDGGRHFH